MRHISFAIAILAALSLFLNQSRAADSTDDTYDSPRLAALAKELASADAPNSATIVDKFFRDMQDNAPLVEPVPDDPHSRWITFLWQGNPLTKNVAVLGGPATADRGAKLARLGTNDLWYRTDKVPGDARFSYHFLVDVPDPMPKDPAKQDKYFKEHPMVGDPLSANPSPSHDGAICELPDAPPQPWLTRVPGVSNQFFNVVEQSLTGREVQEAKIKSKILDQERTYGVYTPPGYDAKAAPSWLLVMFDGNGCRYPDSTFPVSVILDNLIAEKKIPSIIAVFVYQTEKRNNELACNEKFADFVADELIPQVRKDYHLAAEPAHTIVSGLSLGGLMSSYCAYHRPEVFGNVLSLSGSYQWFPGMFDGAHEEPGWLTRQYVESPRLPLRFFLTAGKFENFYPFSLLEENRRLRDVLQAKGYNIKYSEFSGGHDPVCWRGPFVDGLQWLTAAKQ